MATANTPADEAIAHLIGRGFTHNPHMNWYEHRWARVAVADAEAACFDVYSFTRDFYGFEAWRAQLTGAPLALFAATIAAAID